MNDMTEQHSFDASRLKWRKSSYSGANGQCVEVAEPARTTVAVRDSKNPDGAVLGFSAAAWGAFVAATKSGAFDL